MKQLLLLSLSIILSHTLAWNQYCSSDNRFTEVPFFADNQLSSQSDVVYGQAVNWQGQLQTLDLNVFYPTLATDPLPKRPFVLLIHGGGFVNGSKEDWDAECREFARRGFVAASINYRLGRNCNQDTLSYDMAVYRALQDTRAALRFTVEHAGDLRIDTAWMFIGGGSAGSGTALGTVYLSQAEWNSYRPAVVQQLGPLEGSGNTLSHTFTLKGIFNNWAAVGKNHIQPEEMLPMVSFHGDSDSTVNIDSSYNNSCVNPPLMYGSRALHQVLVQHGVCSDLTVEIGGGHGIYTNPSGTAFRVSRASCFFKSIFCNTCSPFYDTDSIMPNCSPIFSAIPETYATGAANVYPNPARTHFYIQAPSGSGNGNYRLLDPNGRTLLQGKLSADAWKLPVSISTEGLPNGLYVLVLAKADQYTTHRILIAR